MNERSTDPEFAFVQTRNVAGEIKLVHTFADALEAAKHDETLWKISFTIQSGERIRLVRLPQPPGSTPRFYFDPLLDDNGKSLL